MRSRALSDEGAASSALAFIIAGVLFLAAITLVLYMTNNKVAAERPDRAIAGNAIGAQSVLGLLLSPDDGWDDTRNDWGEFDGLGVWQPGWNGATWEDGFRPGLVEDGILDQERIDAFAALDQAAVEAAFNLDTPDIPLTLHVVIACDEVTVPDCDDAGHTDPDMDLDYGEDVPVSAGIAVEPASLLVRISSTSVDTASVTVYVFPVSPPAPT